MKNINKILLAFLAFGFFSCDNDFDHPVEDIVVSSGTADFTTYVALGNSLTSGYTDGALYQNGQKSAYPVILHRFFPNSGEFKIPLTADNIGGFKKLGEEGKLIFKSSIKAPIRLQSVTENLDTVVGSFNNLGVTGAKSFHLLSNAYGDAAGLQTGTANPYFVRMASSAQASVVADAVAQKPTFFTLWIGNNDVLGYASGGGTGIDQTGNTNPATYKSKDISDPAVVKNSINNIIKALVESENKPKGAVGNLPSITSVPYFITVPYKPLSPANPNFGPQIDKLNETFSKLNKVFEALGHADRKVVFSKTAASAVVIQDETLKNISAELEAALGQNGFDKVKAKIYATTYAQSRQANEKDLIVLPAQSVIGAVDKARVAELMAQGLTQEDAGGLSMGGITYPLQDQWVLIPSELVLINKATDAYNTAISELAAKYDLALVDTKNEMNVLNSKSGILFYGNTYRATFVTGGAFSLDGVHPTGKGYAIIANMFARAINKKYGSTLPQVDPAQYGSFEVQR